MFFGRIISIPLAAFITVALFLLMRFLVIPDDFQLDEEIDGGAISITRQLEEPETEFNERNQANRPVLDQPPPPPPSTRESIDPQIDAGIGALPDFNFNPGIGAGFNPDRDAQPLVRIPPQYPDRCRSSTTEYVLVEFDVTPDGSVVNPRVIESSNRCFDRSSTRAVTRWKYAPKIVDNQPAPRIGVVTQFTYQPAED